MSGQTDPDALYTLDELDAITRQSGTFKFTLEDVILLLLYADPLPIEGKTRLMKQVFLAITELLPEKDAEPVVFRKHRFGPYSERVEGAAEQLAFANKVEARRGKGRGDYQLSITPRGRAHIKAKFDSLPDDARAAFKQKRLEWDTFTPAGMIGYVYVHNKDYLEKSVLKKRFGLDWSDKEQEDAQ